MRWRRLSPIESLWRSPRTKVGFPKVTWRPNWNGPRPSTAFVFEIWMLQRYIVRLHEIPELYIVLVDQHLASLGTAFSARRRFVKRRVKLFTGRDIDSKYLQSFHFDHFQINLVVFEINLPERTSTTEWSSIGWHSANAAATKNRKNLWKSTDPSIRPILTRNKFSPVCGQLSLSRPTRRWRLPKAPSPMSRRWRPALVSRLRLQEKFEIAWRLDMLGWTSVLAAWYNLIGHNSISVLATCTAEPAELQAFLGFCAGKIDEASGPWSRFEVPIFCRIQCPAKISDFSFFGSPNFRLCSRLATSKGSWISWPRRWRNSMQSLTSWTNIMPLVRHQASTKSAQLNFCSLSSANLKCWGTGANSSTWLEVVDTSWAKNEGCNFCVRSLRFLVTLQV